MNIKGANNYNIYNQPKVQAEPKSNAENQKKAEPQTEKAIKIITGLKEKSSQFDLFAQRLEEMRKQTKASAEQYEIQRKCMLIAMRIMQGDNVPHEDIIYLAENAPELYAKAIILRMQKENPEDHKRVSEDKKDNPASSGEPAKAAAAPEIKAAPESGASESGGDSQD